MDATRAAATSDRAPPQKGGRASLACRLVMLPCAPPPSSLVPIPPSPPAENVTPVPFFPAAFSSSFLLRDAPRSLTRAPSPSPSPILLVKAPPQTAGFGLAGYINHRIVLSYGLERDVLTSSYLRETRAVVDGPQAHLPRPGLYRRISGSVAAVVPSAGGADSIALSEARPLSPPPVESRAVPVSADDLAIRGFCATSGLCPIPTWT